MKNKLKISTLITFLFIVFGIFVVYAAQYYNISNNSQLTVNEWGTGGVIYNSCGPGIFVPTNTSGEINTFISKKPTCTKLCPFSTSYNNGTTKCEATPSCSSGTYDTVNNNCIISNNYNATPLINVCYYPTYPFGCLPSGLFQCLCRKTIMDTGTRLPQNNIIIGYTCPSGGILSGTTCINSATTDYICPAGTSLNGTTDKCESTPG